MPRNASGIYALPAGNPVIPQEIIETDWANNTMTDVAAALTDSLSRSGFGGMTAPFRNADGSVTNPGITFTNEPTSGWYRESLNTFWFSVGNEDIFQVTKDGIALTPGKNVSGIVTGPTIQDDEIVAPKKAQEWFESDTGALYMRYENPDATFCWIQMNGIAGDFLPDSGLDTALGDYADDTAAAAGGVAIGALYRTANAVKVRIA